MKKVTDELNFLIFQETITLDEADNATDVVLSTRVAPGVSSLIHMHICRYADVMSARA